MSRLFTVGFMYRGTLYYAIVSYTAASDAVYFIRCQNEKLNLMFPKGYITYKGLDGYELTDEYKIPALEDLITLIGKAVKKKIVQEIGEHSEEKIRK